MLLVIIITLAIALFALKPTKPIFYADEKAQEIYYRTYRFLKEKSGLIDIKLTGYEKPKDIAAIAGLPERDFEERMAEIYRDESYYKGVLAYSKGWKFLWWGHTPNDGEIWQYRQQNLGKNSLYEGARERYHGHLADTRQYFDVDGINLSPSNTGYNKRRLYELLGATWFEQLVMEADNLDNINEAWNFTNDVDGRPRRHPTGTEVEVGTEYYERAEELWKQMDAAKRSVELLLDQRPAS